MTLSAVHHGDETGRVYLDHAASAPLCAAARAAMLVAMDVSGNPSSVHQDGQKARGIVESARRDVACLMGVRPDEIVFTSGATEALAMAIFGACGSGIVQRIICAPTEHAAILEAVKQVDVPVDWLDVDENGALDLDQLADFLTKQTRPALICVQAANNETGALQPVKDIAQLLVGSHHILCVDAVQVIGKQALDFAHPMMHLVAVSAHKFGGPQGVGALIVKDGLRLTPRSLGGGQEKNRRGGTQATILISGMGAAARACTNGLYDMQAIEKWRDQLEEVMSTMCDNLVIFSKGTQRIGHITNFAVPGLKGHSALIGFDMENIAVSVGSACSSGKIASSHVLKAMRVGEALSQSGIRVSLGHCTTEHDLTAFTKAFEKICRRRQNAVA